MYGDISYSEGSLFGIPEASIFWQPKLGLGLRLGITNRRLNSEFITNFRNITSFRNTKCNLLYHALVVSRCITFWLVCLWRNREVFELIVISEETFVFVRFYGLWSDIWSMKLPLNFLTTNSDPFDAWEGPILSLYMELKHFIDTLSTRTRRQMWLTLTIRQTWADDSSKMSYNFQKISTFWNFMTIFGLAMRKAFN